MDEENDLHGLKEAINNFLWMHLPSTVTIGEADSLAVGWYEQLKALHRQKQGDRPAAEPMYGGRFA